MKEGLVDAVTLTKLLKLAVEVDIADVVIDLLLVTVALTESDAGIDKLIKEDGDGNNAVGDIDSELILVNVAFEDRLNTIETVAITLPVFAAVNDRTVLEVIEGRNESVTVRVSKGETLEEPVPDTVTEIVVSTELVKDVCGVTLDENDIETDCVLTDEELSNAVPLEYNDVVGKAETMPERVKNIDCVALDLLLDDTSDVVDREGVEDALADDRGVGVEITDIDFRPLTVTDALTRLVPLSEK